MDAHRFIVNALKEHDGDIDAEAVHDRIVHMLNTPFFQSGGSRADVLMVRQCFKEFESLVAHGPAPKPYLGRVLQLADRWHRMGHSLAGTESQRALLRYNSALLHSVVIEAINGTEEEQLGKG